MTMKPKDIVRRIMTMHYDLAACHCWVCEAGRDAGLHARSDLPMHATPEFPAVHVDWGAHRWTFDLKFYDEWVKAARESEAKVESL